MKAITSSSSNPDPGPRPAKQRQAFAVLAREHHRGLLTYGRALSKNETVAADLVQEAFVSAWRNLDRFDVTRDFGAWMRGIVHNKWREHLRRHRREVDVDDETLKVWEERFVGWDENRLAGNADLFEALEDCLRRLPATTREAVQRFYYQDELGEAIAGSLGVEVITFRKRLQRARDTLRTCLDRKLPNHV